MYKGLSYATNKVWKDGNIISWKDSVTNDVNHSLHYGSGAFEGIRFYDTAFGPKIFKLKDHIDRLLYSSKVSNIDIKFTTYQIIEACKQVVKLSGEKSGYIRPIAFFGEGKMGVNPNGAESHLQISAWRWGRYLSEKPINVKIASIRRTDPRTADMKAKISGTYVNSTSAVFEIKKDGYDEGLLLDTSDNIAEGPGENIFFVKGNTVYTPKLGSILPGITRSTIIALLKIELGLQVVEETISPDRLSEFDEAFFVGTAAEVTHIGTITNELGEKFFYNSGGNATISRKIQEIYMGVVTGKNEKYLSWLS